jgi:hypothetical protein
MERGEECDCREKEVGGVYSCIHPFSVDYYATCSSSGLMWVSSHLQLFDFELLKLDYQ